MTTLTLEQVAFWDETHKKVYVGFQGANGSNTQCCFKWDANCALDSEGELAESSSYLLKMKYTEEVRLCLGVGQVRKIGEAIAKGIRAMPFDYSGRTLLTIKDYMKRIVNEIARVKSLTGKSGPWYVNTRTTDVVWDSEPIQKLPGVGKVFGDYFISRNIFTIKDLKDYPEPELDKLMKPRTLAMTRLKFLYRLAKASNEGVVPDNLVIDHTLAENPYKSLYGDDWMKNIGASRFLSHYRCITDLVQHIHDETKKMYQGTEHEDDWLFYHDALSLMTAKDTVAWMKEKVWKADGIVVPGLGSRSGFRNSGDRAKDARGGARIKGSSEARQKSWVHPDAQESRLKSVEESIKKINIKIESQSNFLDEDM
eukprot:scaffold75072_cov51-Attheya_sp.AAC.2